MKMQKSFERMGERLKSKATYAATGIVVAIDGDTAIVRVTDGTMVRAKLSRPVKINAVVLLGAEPQAKNELRILDVRDGDALQNQHGDTHTIGGIDPIKIWFAQIAEWTVEPVGLSLKIQRGTAQTVGGYLLPSIETVNLAAYAPASGARYVVISLNADGNITVVSGVIRPNINQLTVSDIPARQTQTTPLWAVLLYAGQTGISVSGVRTDLIDLRLASALGVQQGGGTWGSITGTLSNQADLQAALDGKQSLDGDLTAIAQLSPAENDIIQRKSGAWTNRTMTQLAADLTTLAPINSPAFTGTPTAPNPPGADNSNRLATTAWVNGMVGAGTWMPTLTNTTNILASTAYECTYQRISNIVSFAGLVVINPIGTGNVVMKMSLPISSNFTLTNDASGNITAPGASQIAGSIIPDTSLKTLDFRFYAPTSGNIFCRFAGQYIIK